MLTMTEPGMNSETLVAPIPCPDAWPLVRLRHIARKIGSGATPTGGQAAYLPIRSRFALVRSQNVFDRRFSEAGLAFISDTQAEGLRNALLEEGDLLLNITGDGVTFGRACAVPCEVLPACVNQHVSIIRVDRDRADPGYLLSYLTHPTVKEYVEAFNAGGSRRAITKAHIESFVVPLPPLETQRSIASLLTAFDDRIALLRETNATLEAIAQALFKSWFVDFDPVRAKQQGLAPAGMDEATAALFPGSFEDSVLGNVPLGWQVNCVEEIADRVGMGPFGSNIKIETFVEIGIPIISGPHLHEALLEDLQFKFITVEHADRLKNSCVGPGDIVFTHAGTIGQVSLVPADARYGRYILSQRQFYLRCDSKKMAPSWMTYFFRSPKGQHLLLANASQVGVPSIARPVSYLRSIQFVLPPLALVNRFAEVVDHLHRHVVVDRSRIQTLATLRDTLLPRLISGQLRLPEAEALAA